MRCCEKDGGWNEDDFEECDDCSVLCQRRRIRAENLKTHIAQTVLLSGDQVQMYAVLRGYATDGAPDIEEPPLGGHTRHRPH